MSQLGAAIAARRAERAQQQAVVNAAATEAAQAAAKVASANYDATADAIHRFSADTSQPSQPPLNADLKFNWSAMNEERRIEGPDARKNQYTGVRRWSWTDTPSGAKVLRMDETGTLGNGYGKSYVRETKTIRYYPASGIEMNTFSAEPLWTTWSPAFESTILYGDNAFAARMDGKGFDISIPPGAIDAGMLGTAVAALDGELPASFRIWVVTATGEVVPADFKVVGHASVKVPTTPKSGSCAGTDTHSERADVTTLSLSGGLPFATWTVLSAAPHLFVAPYITCRVMH